MTELWLLYILTLAPGSKGTMTIQHYASERTCWQAAQAVMNVPPPLMPNKRALCVKAGRV